MMKSFFVAVASILMSTTIAGGQTTADTQMSMPDGMTGNMSDMDMAMQMPPVTAEMIGESGMRRLVFYANRSVAALEEVLENVDSADTAKKIEINNKFRSTVARLLDAGTRSELEFEQVAFFFMAAVIDRFGEEFIQRIVRAGEGQDMLTLFRYVSVVGDPDQEGADHGAQFLNNLAAISEDAMPVADFEEVVRTPEAEIRPVAFPSANRAELSIIDRIVINNGEWIITVIRGDTLSLYSSAIFGNASSYDLIFKANQDQIRNPNIINVGQRILLPRP